VYSSNNTHEKHLKHTDIESWPSLQEMPLNAILLTPLFRVAWSLGLMAEQLREHLHMITPAAASLSQGFTSSFTKSYKFAGYNKVL
jgi:hypothetical protein